MSTFVVPLISTSDFTSDFEDLVIPYIKTKYSISNPIKTDTDHFDFHVGFYDFFRPYEITALQTDTIVEDWTNGGRMFTAWTNIEIHIRMERLTDNKVDPQLGNMEREIIKIITQYRTNDIAGITSMVYNGGQRVYQATDDHATTDWRCIVKARLKYQKVDIS